MDNHLHQVADAQTALQLYFALAPDEILLYALGLAAGQLGARTDMTPREAIDKVIEEGGFEIDGWDGEATRRTTNNYRKLYDGFAFVASRKMPQG